MTDSKLPARIEPDTAAAQSVQRWQLIRALTLFQIKLVVDGLKDLVLGPLSMVAGIVDLARGSAPPSGLFHDVLRAGASFDRWVGLFDEVERPKNALSAGPSEAPIEPKLDDHLQRLEQVILAQQVRGGVTAEAKQAVDRALDLLEAGMARHGNKAPGVPGPGGPSIHGRVD